MSEIKEINQLPGEVLIEIFTYLDKDSLRNVSQVCQSWRQLVIASTRLLRQLEAFVRTATIDSIIAEHASMPVITLMLHTHPLRTTEETESFEVKLKQFLDTHETTVQFTEMVFYDMRFLTTHIARLKSLKHLNLVCSRSPIDAQPLALLDLPQLKTLGLKNATHALRCLRQPSLEVLKVIDNGSDKADINLTNFLKLHAGLREMKFMGFIPHLSDIDSYRFQLASLSVLLKGQQETPTSSILELIQSQSESLRELKLIGFNTHEFIEFAVNDMTLTKLEIDMTRVRSDLALMRPNRSIKNLMVQSIALNIGQMVKVIEACPAVETLRVVSNTNLRFGEWLTVTAKTMVNLKHLTIDSLLSMLPPKNLRLNSLESLTLTKLGNEAQIHGFVQLASRCPNLKRLVVTGFGLHFIQSSMAENEQLEDTSMCPNDMLFLLVALPHLEELELRGKFTLTDDIVDVLLNDSCKLKRFNFSADFDVDLKGRLSKLNRSRIQCKVLPIDDGRRATKRKSSENEDTLRGGDSN